MYIIGLILEYTVWQCWLRLLIAVCTTNASNPSRCRIVQRPILTRGTGSQKHITRATIYRSNRLFLLPYDNPVTCLDGKLESVSVPKLF